MLVSYGLGSYDCEGGFGQREGGNENGGTSRNENLGNEPGPDIDETLN